MRRVSADRPEPAIIGEAADVLRRGGLVAFPTETVYGLGANALDDAAVQSIFEAKGRPTNNPIIVHVADAAAARELVSNWPERAERLAELFWPGPLTLVLPRQPSIPGVVTARGPTVGVRVPAHPVALALVKAAGIPIAAPSANRSARVSATTAEHVLRGLKGRVDLVLDGGPTPGGLESTVLDLTSNPPRLLRPGLVSVDDLEAVIGPVEVAGLPKGEQLRSPGMLERHYAPRVALVGVEGSAEGYVAQLLKDGKRIGWLRLIRKAEGGRRKAEHGVVEIEMPDDVAAYSARLYAALHELDDAGVGCIVVDLPPQQDQWMAVRDRLRRAAHDGSPRPS